MTDVVQIRLTNGDLVVGRMINRDPYGNVSLEYVMIQEFFDNNAALLSKYVPFASDDYLEIHESKIITMKSVTAEFEKYYYLCVQHNAEVVEPVTVRNLRMANYSMSQESKKAARDFVLTANKHNVDLAPLKEGPKH